MSEPCFCGDPRCLYNQGKQNTCSMMECSSCADLKRRVADLEKSLSGRARFQENEALKNLCKDMAGALEEIAKAYKEPTLKRLVDMLLEKFKEVMK